MKYAFLVGAALLFAGNQAFANPCPPGNPPTNCAPPTGAIFDLDGTVDFGAYHQYFTSFVATGTSTNVSFAIREDPAFISLDDVSVTQGGGANLLLNPGFELGPLGANAPTNWTFLNSFGATFAGVVQNNNPHSGTNNYYDGAVQAYDGITQAIATTPGLLYDISFWVGDNSGARTYSRLSTDGDVSDTGGNGIDLLVYAGDIPTLTPVPEPATLTMMGLGLAAAYRKRRRS